ncbi:Centromere protein [Dirofilaria immitis]
MLVQDEIIEELEKKGQKVEFDKEVIAQVAFAICNTLCGVWPNELLQFAKHARRSVVNISDLTLLFRRNESILSLIRNIVGSLLLPVRKRQSRKDTNKKNTKTTKSTEKVDNENSKNVNNLLFEKNSLKLGDFWNQPSTSRDRLLPSSETLKSATMEKKCLPDSMSLQRKKVAAKKKGMKETPYCKQKADAITESRKADNSKERRSQTTKQWLQTLFYPDSSKSEEKEELEFLDNNISPPCYSSKRNLREQKPQFVTGSINRDNQEIRETNDMNIPICTTNLSKEVKMDEKNPTVSVMKLDNEMLIESSTAVIASRETTPYIQANKSKTEFQIENLPDGDSIFCPEISILNSARRIHRLFSTNKGQFMNTSSRSSFCTADDCFSSFKFESDSEDSDQNRSLLEIDVTDNKNALSSTITSNRCFADKCASMNNNQEKDLNEISSIQISKGTNSNITVNIYV